MFMPLKQGGYVDGRYAPGGAKCFQFLAHGVPVQGAPSRCVCGAKAILPSGDPVCCAGKLMGLFQGRFHFPDFRIQGVAAGFEGFQPDEGRVPLGLAVPLGKLGTVGVVSAVGTERIKALSIGHIRKGH